MPAGGFQSVPQVPAKQLPHWPALQCRESAYLFLLDSKGTFSPSCPRCTCPRVSIARGENSLRAYSTMTVLSSVPPLGRAAGAWRSCPLRIRRRIRYWRDVGTCRSSRHVIRQQAREDSVEGVPKDAPGLLPTRDAHPQGFPGSLRDCLKILPGDDDLGAIGTLPAVSCLFCHSLHRCE